MTVKNRTMHLWDGDLLSLEDFLRQHGNGGRSYILYKTKTGKIVYFRKEASHSRIEKLIEEFDLKWMVDITISSTKFKVIDGGKEESANKTNC